MLSCHRVCSVAIGYARSYYGMLRYIWVCSFTVGYADVLYKNNLYSMNFKIGFIYLIELTIIIVEALHSPIIGLCCVTFKCQNT